MNTLLLLPGLFAADGGIERILRLYVRAVGELTAAGKRTRVVVLNDGPVAPERLAPYASPALDQVVTCRRNKIACVWHALRLARRSDRVLCGHMHLLRLGHLARRFAPRLKVYLVAHGIEVWRAFTASERAALQATTRILCVSDYTRRRLLSNCPELQPAQLVVQPNALDPQFEVAPTQATSLEPGLILSVARLSAAEAYKGVDHVIDALPSIRRSVSGVRLRVVGEGDDRGRLERRTAELGLAGVVEFAGRESDAALRGHFAACQLFALPSGGEGFGLVYLEALAHGKPCIAARAGGAPEIVNESCGALVPYGDIDALAAAAVAALQRPWNEASLRARAKEFSYPRFKDQLSLALAA